MRIFSLDTIRQTISRDGYVFDETFINNSEDRDLSIRIALNEKDICDFKLMKSLDVN